jgi:hypothetical protein
MNAGHAQPTRPDDRVIDGEFEDLSDPKRPTNPPSEWTKN